RIRRWNIVGKVDRSRGEDQLVDEWKPSRVGLGALDAHELYLRVTQRLLNGGRLRTADVDRGIDLACLQSLECIVSGERHQFGVSTHQTVRHDQRLDERTRSASRYAGSNALSKELIDVDQRVGVTVENPQRLVVEACEHHQVVRLWKRSDASLHEGDVHPRLG